MSSIANRVMGVLSSPGAPGAFTQQLTDERLRKALQDIGQNPSEAAAISLIQGQQARGQQGEVAQQFADLARGQGPSLAQQLLRASQDQAAQQALGLARSSTASPGLALRQALQAQTQLNLRGNQQAAQLRAQEQLSALQNLAQVLGQMRQQDIGILQGFQQTGATRPEQGRLSRLGRIFGGIAGAALPIAGMAFAGPAGGVAGQAAASTVASPSSSINLGAPKLGA
jgi:hypothetical protein